MTDRRSFFARLASVSAGLWAGKKAAAQQPQHQHPQPPPTAAGPRPASNISSPTPGVHLPDLPKLSFQMVNGAKEFHLIAEVVRTEFVPGRVVDAWGYN